MELITQSIDIILHLDQHLNAWVAQFGVFIYVILFLIIFCETGLVITPILPGDSLLFALGALAASESSTLDIKILGSSLIVAAILGDTVNYTAGHFIGPKVFKSESSRWLSKRHLLRTQEFYERYGGKTIILARFVPIVRTFAPFVAGIGKMNYASFVTYNIVGGIFWILSFLLAGFYFGHLPIIKDRFHVVIFGIIGVSVLPIVFEYLRARRTNHA